MKNITEYGLIGEKLPHSYSAEIHAMLCDYDYRLCELSKEELPAFLTERKFRGINVTIPYKKDVIPFLAYLDEKAKRIGAVNTVINRNGKLYGYNTDYYGLSSLFSRASINVEGKNALILGTGGTSRTAFTVLQDLKAARITIASRTARENAVTYEEAMKLTDTEIIVNTTPVGMYPNPDGCPIDIDAFPKLCGVADAIYNPLRTNLVLRARARGISAIGGLYMLVAQAQAASCFFLGEEPHEDMNTVERVTNAVRQSKENIVLVGMPTSGKSSIGKVLSEKTGRAFLDADRVFEEKLGISPAAFIRQNGEEAFRDKESEILSCCANRSGAVIATGGGAILRERNRPILARNGTIFFIDRSVDKLLCCGDRPLSSTRDALKNLYDTRYPLYRSFCDIRIDGDGTVNAVADQVLSEFNARKEGF